MIQWRKYTAIFIGCLLVAVFVYDVLAITNGGTEASISHMIIEWSYKYPAVTFFTGFVMGHLFWRVRSTPILDKIDDSTRAN